MARSFVAASSQKLANTSFSGITGASTLTLVGWVNRGAGTRIAFGGERDGAYTGGFMIVTIPGDYTYFLTHNGVQDYGFLFNSLTGWYHLAMRYDGGAGTNAGRLRAYVNGANALLDFAGTTIPATIGTTSEFALGHDVTAYGDGAHAEVALYNVALSDAEIASLGTDCYSPLLVRPSALIGYWDCLGRGTDEVDRVGGQHLTNTNSVTVSDHPRVIYPRRRSVYAIPSAAGGAAPFIPIIGRGPGLALVGSGGLAA